MLCLFFSKQIKEILDTLHDLEEKRVLEISREKFVTNKLFISFLSIILSNGVFASLPNDPHLSKQWYLESHLKMFTTWESYDPQKEIVVAVLDSGIDLTHDDLKKRLWVNKAEEHGLPNVDDDKNGFVDDIHGYNFISKNPNVQDDLGHGTQCAGIIAAEVNNGIGIVGIAPSHVKVMAVKTIGKAGIFNLESAVAGIYYAVDNGAKVINMYFVSSSKCFSSKRKKSIFIVEKAKSEKLITI